MSRYRAAAIGSAAPRGTGPGSVTWRSHVVVDGRAVFRRLARAIPEHIRRQTARGLDFSGAPLPVYDADTIARRRRAGRQSRTDLRRSGRLLRGLALLDRGRGRYSLVAGPGRIGATRGLDRLGFDLGRIDERGARRLAAEIKRSKPLAEKRGPPRGLR